MPAKTSAAIVSTGKPIRCPSTIAISRAAKSRPSPSAPNSSMNATTSTAVSRRLVASRPLKLLAAIETPRPRRVCSGARRGHRKVNLGNRLLFRSAFEIFRGLETEIAGDEIRREDLDARVVIEHRVVEVLLGGKVAEDDGFGDAGGGGDFLGGGAGESFAGEEIEGGFDEVKAAVAGVEAWGGGAWIGHSFHCKL